MTTAGRARARGVGIIAACVVALLSMALSLRAISTQSEVAQRESSRALAKAEQSLAVQNLADCALMDLFRVRPGDSPPTTPRGQEQAARIEAAYLARGCPR